MMTLGEVLSDARHRQVAIGHFSDLVALKAVTETVRELKTAVDRPRRFA